MSVTESVEKNNIIFGPLNSRRFGMSLGIDLSPSHKQCNFDCLYCELAPAVTVDKQADTITVEAIITELKKHLDEKIDVITLTANGEPTLYPYLNELIDAINKIKGDTETLILTNSASLAEERVYNALLKLDQVKFSLDAITPLLFKKIDRPHNSVKIEEIAQRIAAFSKEYRGKIFIETLFVSGINDTKEEVEKLNDFLLGINVSRIDLGTIDRPPAYCVKGVDYQKLYELSLLFDSSLPIHIASRQNASIVQKSYTEEEIINILNKRPLTQEDIELLFDKKSQKLFNELLAKNALSKVVYNHILFYRPIKKL